MDSTYLINAASNLVIEAFLKEIEDFPYIDHWNWPTDTRGDPPFKVYKQYSEKNNCTYFLGNETVKALLVVNYWGVLITAASKDTDELYRFLASMVEAYPKVQPDDGTIPIAFHYYDPARGLVNATRNLLVPSWNEIQNNYPRAVRESLNTLFDPSYRPTTGGQLVIFHGRPGTGKTYTIRALAREWKYWCTVRYVVDPERFFGDANYMMEMLIQDGADNHDHWSLIVCEDAGEILAKDAKMMTGQGLSRLLNLTDGLIGQGLNLLVLITTNEKISSFHEAVQRPGRKSYEVEFTSFSQSEADEWFALSNIKPPEKLSGHTLSDLFAALNAHNSGVVRAVKSLGLVR